MAWIVALAVLLTGVVAINVAVIRLNVQLDRRSQERVRLQDSIARLQSDLSAAAARTRIESDARAKLGLVPADPTAITYIHLPRR